MRIDADDSADLHFVDTALMVGAIDVVELRAWADHAIAQLTAPPLWLFDLGEFDGPAFQWTRVIGFQPHGPRIDAAAMAGIALARGRQIDPSVRSPVAASHALADNPALGERFHQTFPFLDY